KVMNRMIEGDVGSGKTLVAIIAAFLAVKNGFQASVMAPTETLVLQHLKNFRRILAPFNIECCEVLGSQSKKERTEILEKIHNGSANIIIGTHALLSETTIFKNLGLIVTDEQHRFGVNQRSLFSKKGDGCHSLVMSATPIPRSLSLVLYGDLKLSLIDELPPGRTPIKTYIIGYDKHDRALNFIKSFVEKK
ncbi:MAG: DEAD/DEAH box helicase, partial [Oscillospiraceae bacterium]